MANSKKCYETQLIHGDGRFNVGGIKNFEKHAEFEKCGRSYVVVSIIGPQSSGKSTLLNCLFRTKFVEMDVSRRKQTTNGIWIAISNETQPSTLVLDVEGTDGRERAQSDDVTFERQSSLFALAVSHVVMINIWCNEIGRDHAANKPLLKVVFQARKKLGDPRKVTLFFVIRDLTPTPLDYLKQILIQDIQEIWEDVRGAKGDETPLSELFNVEVIALPHYAYEKEKFMHEVGIMRQRIFGRGGDQYEVVPVSGFLNSSQQIWEDIKMNKDLDLPSFKAVFATQWCKRIADEKHLTFKAKKEWCHLKEDDSAFVHKLNSLLNVCFKEYDDETIGYDEVARSTYQNQLRQNLFQIFKSPLKSALNHTRSRVMDEMKASLGNYLNGKKFSTAATRCMSQFDEKCPDVIIGIEEAKEYKISARKKLERDITSLREAKISELTLLYQENLKRELAARVESMLQEATIVTWPSIRVLFWGETNKAKSKLEAGISEFDHVDDHTINEKVKSLVDYGRYVVEEKAMAEAKIVQIRMKERWLTMLLQRESDQMPRKIKEKIEGNAEKANSASLEVLSVLVAIRLYDTTDAIETTLRDVFMGSSSSNGTTSQEFNLQASNTWDKVCPSSQTLIQPHKCIELWDQFKEEAKKLTVLFTQNKDFKAAVKKKPPGLLYTILLGFLSVFLPGVGPLVLRMTRDAFMEDAETESDTKNTEGLLE